MIEETRALKRVMSTVDPNSVLAFGDYEFDLGRFELRRSGARVPLEPQAFDLLAYLAAHRERVVAKDELLNAVWGTRFVGESARPTRIKQIRQAVGDDGRSQSVVRTAHGRGYQFIAAVTVVLPISLTAVADPGPCHDQQAIGQPDRLDIDGAGALPALGRRWGAPLVNVA